MNCNDELLVDEIRKRPDAPENKTVRDHLATCSRCQQRVSQLAANDDWWAEASSVLIETLDEGTETRSILVALDSTGAPVSTDEVVRIDESDGNLNSVDFEQVSLNFLDAPSHPEMLGRLGRYEIERLIGAGGMGIVLKAFDTELHRVVAIKVLAPHLAHSGAARRRFAREAQAAAAVVNDNVIPIHNVETGAKLPYLVMQYVPGASLQARVDQNGPLTVDETLRIGAQIADGLAAAHQQGLIHRDVKPANILLEQDVDRVLISDFGLARAVDDASLTRSGIVAGTPHYMSPEQSRGMGIDCRSDLFGLGSVFYFMLTGRPPFRADGAMAVLNRICHDPHRRVCEVNNGVPLELSRLIDRLLEKDPADRYTTADDVSSELSMLLTSWRTPGGRRLLMKSKRESVLSQLSRPKKITVFAIAFTLISLATLPWLFDRGDAPTVVNDSVPVTVAPAKLQANAERNDGDKKGSQFAVAETTAALSEPQPVPPPVPPIVSTGQVVPDPPTVVRELTTMESDDVEFFQEIAGIDNELQNIERMRTQILLDPRPDVWRNEFDSLDIETRALDGGTLAPKGE